MLEHRVVEKFAVVVGFQARLEEMLDALRFGGCQFWSQKDAADTK